MLCLEEVFILELQTFLEQLAEEYRGVTCFTTSVDIPSRKKTKTVQGDALVRCSKGENKFSLNLTVEARGF